MSDLVRVRVGDREFNVGRAHAEANDLKVLDEPTHLRDGSLRPTTRAGGRQIKPRTTVETEAKKKADKPTGDAPPSVESQ